MTETYSAIAVNSRFKMLRILRLRIQAGRTQNPNFQNTNELTYKTFEQGGKNQLTVESIATSFASAQCSKTRIPFYGEDLLTTTKKIFAHLS